MRKLLIALLLSAILSLSCGVDWLLDRHEDIQKEVDKFGDE